MRDKVAVGIKVFGAALLLLVAACSSSGDAPDDHTSTPLTALVLPASAVTGVGSLTFSTVRVVPDGTSVTKSAFTLQECSHKFDSEGHRRERRQVEYLNSAGATDVSVEVVRYDRGWAAKAYAEEKAALKACTKKQDRTSRAAKERLAHDTVISVSGGGLNPDGTMYFTGSVYQWRKDLLVASYAYRPSLDDAYNTAVALARRETTKLAAAK